MQFSADVTAAIKAKAFARRIENALVAAFVAQESRGRTFATRYEPAFCYFVSLAKWAPLTGVSQMTERVGQGTSWGLMQVMGARARELGFKGLLPELCQAEVGLEFGCCALKDLQTRFGVPAPNVHQGFEEAVAAAYNAGSPRVAPDGKLVNQAYVDGVHAFYREFKEAGF